MRQSEQRSFTAGENEAEVAEVAEVGEVGEVGEVAEVGEVGCGRLPWILHEWIMEIDCLELLSKLETTWITMAVLDSYVPVATLLIPKVNHFDKPRPPSSKRRAAAR